jgi:hypothetical protein
MGLELKLVKMKNRTLLNRMSHSFRVGQRLNRVPISLGVRKTWRLVNKLVRRTKMKWASYLSSLLELSMTIQTTTRTLLVVPPLETQWSIGWLHKGILELIHLSRLPTVHQETLDRVSFKKGCVHILILKLETSVNTIKICQPSMQFNCKMPRQPYIG